MATDRSSLLPFAATLLGVASIACEGRSSPSPAVTARDSAGIVVVSNDLARLTAKCSVGAEPGPVIGTVTGDPDHELYRVFGASRLSDGRIVLVNQGSQQLRFYDARGRHLMNAGRAGNGPGEFRDAFYLWVLPGDTIWVGDYRPWQFLVFAPDARWVRTVRPRPEYPNPPGTINVLDDGRSILAERPFSPLGTTFQLALITIVSHGPDGVLLDTIGTYPDGRWGRISDDPGAPGLYPLFEAFTRVRAAGARVVIGHGSRPELSILDASRGMRTERIVRWTTGPRAVSQADIEAERRRIAEPYRDLDPAMRQRLVDPLVSDERPVADEFPAFTTFMLGRDGRLWVREYPRPTGPERQEWVAFNPDGEFDCRATLPAVDQILEFGRDYFLALDRDDLGVERVVKHSVGPASGPE